jgi:hypothetical protein
MLSSRLPISQCDRLAREILSHPVSLANFLITILFMFDVVFATIGYILTLAAGHIYPQRQPACSRMGSGTDLLCLRAGGGGHSIIGTAEWNHWLAGHP